LWRAFGATGVALAAALALRFVAIEPREIGLACAAAPETALCQARAALVFTFHSHVLGGAALLAGIAAFFTEKRVFVESALWIGVVALTLYNPELGAAGFLLGFLAALGEPNAI
jgi:hypothetical protein